MAGKTSKAIGDELAEILDIYRDDLGKAAEKAIKKVAKETAQKIKDASPRSNNASGVHYADGWTTSRKRTGVIFVYNKDKPQLTHLLEKGHALPQGGRAKAQPHIKPAEDWAASVIVERVKREVE